MTHSFPTRRSSDLSMTRSPAASASPISFSTLCKMHVFRKIGRLFKIKTRLEAWAVIYAITVGAVYRGTWYLHQYPGVSGRSEEHTSELQSLMRISYAVFFLKKKNTHKQHTT